MNTDNSNPTRSLVRDFIRAYLRLSAVIVVALLAAGCAELRWHKAGGDAETFKQDVEQCRRTARNRAAVEAWPFGLITPRVIGVDRQGRAIMLHPPPQDTERFLLEGDLTRSCMREKGYSLVPVKKSHDE